MSVTGSNFASRDYTDKAMLGGTRTDASTWISDSSVNVRFLDGVRGSRQVVVTAGTEGTTSNLFTYFAPAIMMPFVDGALLQPTSYKSNGPGTGATVLFVHGALMGHASYCAMVRISNSVVGSSIWTSDSSLACLTGQGGGGGPVIQVTAGELVNSASRTWSYDGPHPFQIVDTGDPSLAGGMITILGSNYAENDLTQKSRFGPTSVISLKSTLPLSCISDVFDCAFLRPPSHIRVHIYVHVYTYIYIYMRVHICIYIYICIHVNVQCELSKWSSTTSITCRRPTGPAAIGARDSIVITCIKQFKTMTTSFSFDLHSVQGAIIGNSPATGSCIVHITHTHTHTHTQTHTWNRNIHLCA